MESGEFVLRARRAYEIGRLKWALWTATMTSAPMALSIPSPAMPW